MADERKVWVVTVCKHENLRSFSYEEGSDDTDATECLDCGLFAEGYWEAKTKDCKCDDEQVVFTGQGVQCGGNCKDEY